MEQMLTVTSEELRTRQIKLVEALESGAYAQGGGQLRDDFTGNSDDADKFCCLGVACDIYMKETGKGSWSGWAFEVGDESECAWMPRTVAEWYGFSNATGSMNSPMYSLMKMNDSGVPFPDIAKTIRSAMDDPDTRLFAEYEGVM